MGQSEASNHRRLWTVGTPWPPKGPDEVIWDGTPTTAALLSVARSGDYIVRGPYVLEEAPDV